MQMLVRIHEKYSDTSGFQYRVQLFINHLDSLYKVLHQKYRFLKFLGFLAFLGGRYEELFLVAKREHPRLLGG
jgi:hypothetical protein